MTDSPKSKISINIEDLTAQATEAADETKHEQKTTMNEPTQTKAAIDMPEIFYDCTNNGDRCATSTPDQKQEQPSENPASELDTCSTISEQEQATQTGDCSSDTDAGEGACTSLEKIPSLRNVPEGDVCGLRIKGVSTCRKSKVDKSVSTSAVPEEKQSAIGKSKIDLVPENYAEKKMVISRSLKSYPNALPPAQLLASQSAISVTGSDGIKKAVSTYPRSVGYDQIMQFSKVMPRCNPQIWLPGNQSKPISTAGAANLQCTQNNNNHAIIPDVTGDGQARTIFKPLQISRGRVTEEGDQASKTAVKKITSSTSQISSHSSQIDSACLASSSSGIPSMSTFSISLADSDEEDDHKVPHGGIALDPGSKAYFAHPPTINQQNISDGRPNWFKTQQRNIEGIEEEDEQRSQQRGRFFRGHFDRLERVGLLVSPSSQNISIYSPATHPMLFITPAGLLTVLLKREVAVEMTLDQTIRLVNFRHRAAAATDKRGTSSFIFHAAANMHQERTTMEADIFNNRRVKMTTGAITFSNGPDCYSMSPYGLIHDNLEPKDLSKDLTVSLLYSSSGYGPHLIPRFCELAKSANYIFHKRGAVTVLVNGTRIYQNGRGDVMVYSGRKYLRASPDTGAMHVTTHFVEMAVETNWRVMAKRGDQRMTASFQNMLVSDGFREAGFEQNGRLVYQPVVMVKETLIDNRPPAAAAGDIHGDLAGRAPDQVLYESRARRTRWTNRRRHDVGIADDVDDQVDDDNDDGNNGVYQGCIRLENEV